MAPVILELKAQSWAEVKVLATAQHREMLDQVLSIFNITPDYDLNIMQQGQQLTELTSRLLLSLDKMLDDAAPDIVLAQGDTTTVMTTALACFYRRIAFGHVEAGLRTNDIWNPFPEEMNRVVAGHLASLHFAPTESSRQNLLKEGIDDKTIHVTGNTVIDALLATAEKDFESGVEYDRSKRLILLTSHRRENFGQPMRDSFIAIRNLVEENEDIVVVYPVHPNPHVLEPANEILGNHPRILLIKPMGYSAFVQIMKEAYFIISDSGGVQEEAPALAKPVLVLREETERPEAVIAGVVKLVGTNPALILEYANKLLKDATYYQSLAKGVSPYGDGKAAARIVSVIEKVVV